MHPTPLKITIDRCLLTSLGAYCHHFEGILKMEIAGSFEASIRQLGTTSKTTVIFNWIIILYGIA
jgi:hypothetical protein